MDSVIGKSATLLVLGFATAATVSCAGAGPGPAAAPPGGTEAPVTAVTPVTPVTPEATAVALRASANEQEDREVHVLLEEPRLKLVEITLRRGTELASHSANVPVLIQSSEGSGVVVTENDRIPLDPAHGVFLAPGTLHSVEPTDAMPLVLWVYHLGIPEHGQ